VGFLFRLNLGQGNRQILEGQLPLVLGGQALDVSKPA
jgi:hypothetical protein